MAQSMHSSARRLRRRIALVIWLRCGLIVFTAGGCAWAVWVLVGRLWLGMGGAWLYWPLVAAGPSALAAWVWARRRVPEVTTLCALIDSASSGGGLMMASEEVETGGWRLPTGSDRRLAVRWPYRRSLLMVAAAAAFAATALLTPVRYLRAGDDARRLDLRHEAARIAEKIDTLEEVDILSEGQADSLREKLRQVREKSEAADPVKTWEALDHMESMLAKAAAEPAESRVRAMEQMTEAEALAEALSPREQAMEAMGPERMAEAMAELSKVVEQATAEACELDEQMSKDLAEACREGRLTDSQMRELSAALRRCQGLSREQLERLAGKGLIDPETLARARAAGAGGDPMRLAEMLAGGEGGQGGERTGEGHGKGEEIGEATVAEVIEQWRLGVGRGGIDRGPGDAPMAWTDGSEADGAKFEETVLPPSAVADLKQSRLGGISRGAPRAQDASGSTGGALRGGSADGGSATVGRILPRHRSAVRKYFERRDDN